jgi:hypothetical protein
MVPVDLLDEVLVEGPTQVGGQALARIADLVRRGDLDGWVPAPLAAGATIDLCDAPDEQPTVP